MLCSMRLLVAWNKAYGTYRVVFLGDQQTLALDCTNTNRSLLNCGVSLPKTEL